jgi:hypothetical protein
MNLRRPILALAAALLAVPALANPVYDANYARDRAETEDLQARYMFALDWFDAEAYAATFTEDGTLNWARGTVTGRDAIREEVRGMRAQLAPYYGDDGSGKPVTLRHFITNISITVNGDTATGRSYWFEVANNGPGHTPKIGGFGHYEDELRRVDGHWLFASRKIFNQQLEGRSAAPENPVK